MKPRFDILYNVFFAAAGERFHISDAKANRRIRPFPPSAAGLA